MTSTTLRSTPRTILIKVTAALLSLAFAFFIAESIATVYFVKNNPRYEDMRKQLAGEVQSIDHKSVGQPYLLYVPAPNYASGTNYHNDQGYRGQAVPMQRRPGVSRVLCLGGSTTYGNGVDDADEAYPAQLATLLASDLPQDIRGIEVINAGLEYGTTAELLTHYHFKFHYFRPDLVIINTGGNDAVATSQAFYQPDYSHFRKTMQPVQPLSTVGRTLVKSRFVAWFVIHAIYGGVPENQWIERTGSVPPPTVWHPAAKNPGLAQFIADEELAFTHNLETLIDGIRKDGAEVLLVPFRLAPGAQYANQSINGWTERNERILRKVAIQRQIAVAPFPTGVVSHGNWVDHCHLNAPGNREKAAHLSPYVRRLLWPHTP